MAIKRIKVSNFKSFKDLDVELGNFNVLIGTNASGKSNFIQIFKFLIDIANYGLDNAISMQGGIEYLRNIKIGSSNNLFIKISLSPKFWPFGRMIRTKEKELIRMIILDEIIYIFVLKFKQKGPGFEILEDKLTFKCKFIWSGLKNENFQEKEEFGLGEINIVGGKIKFNLHIPPLVPIRKDDLFLPFLREEKLPAKTLFLESPQFSWFFEDMFCDISMYDFEPKLSKKAVPIIGKAELEEDGSNLAIVLKNILEDREKRRKFSNFLGDLLPFIIKLDVEKFADKSLLFKLQEKYYQNQYLPAFLISDGTINIIALIIALFFEKKSLTIIEETERHIHPYLISKVIDMMKDASKNKQIIVTTHNPEIVKYAGLENILLVSRNKEGFSTISRPADKEEIKTFLKNEIGIEELFVQNLLSV